MEPSIQFGELFSILGAAQGIFLAAVLMIHKRGNRTANRILGALVFVFSLRLLEIAAYWTKYLLVYPHFNATTGSTHYLFGVLLFLYASSLLDKSFTFNKKTWRHFLPFIISILCLLPYFLLSTEQKLFYLENYVYAENPPDERQAPIFYLFLYLAQLPHMLIYLLLTIRLINKHSLQAKSASSSMEASRLRWLQILAIGFGAFFCLWMLYNFSRMAGIPYYRAIDYFTTYSMTILIYTIGYTALRQPEIFSGSLPEAKNGPKYEKSTLTEQQADRYLADLLALMKSEKPFFNSELKLPELAAQLSIPPHHLSQIINEKLNQNFFDFLNYYRVEEVKKRLQDKRNRHFTILSIAFDAGFNNTTSFNSAFKKFSGMTPSAYRKKHASSVI